MRILNNALKLIAFILLGLLAIPVGIIVVAVISIAWQLNPLIGILLAICCLLLIKLWFYIE